MRKFEQFAQFLDVIRNFLHNYRSRGVTRSHFVYFRFYFKQLCDIRMIFSFDTIV